MLNKNKIRLMSRLAIYDKKYGAADRRKGEYFKWDYIYFRNFLTRTGVFIGCLILTFFYALKKILLEQADIMTIDYKFEATKIGFCIIVALVLYTIIGTAVAKSEYKKSRGRVEAYLAMLDKLDAFNRGERGSKRAEGGTSPVMYEDNQNKERKAETGRTNAGIKLPWRRVKPTVGRYGNGQRDEPAEYAENGYGEYPKWDYRKENEQDYERDYERDFQRKYSSIIDDEPRYDAGRGASQNASGDGRYVRQFEQSESDKDYYMRSTGNAQESADWGRAGIGKASGETEKSIDMLKRLKEVRKRDANDDRKSDLLQTDNDSDF